MRKTWRDTEKETHRPALIRWESDERVGMSWGFSKEVICELRLRSAVGMSGKGKLSFPAEYV